MPAAPVTTLPPLPVPSVVAPVAEPKRTQVFGREGSAPGAPAPAAPFAQPPVNVSSADAASGGVHKTQMFGALPLAASLPSAFPERSPAPAAEPVLSAVASSPRVALPPENREAVARGRLTDEAIAVVRTAQRHRRGRLLATLAALGLLAMGGLAVRRWVRTPTPMDAEAGAARDAVAHLLRRDDELSRAKALSELGRWVTSRPDDASFRADLLLALALELDDRQVRLRHLKEMAARLKRELADLESRKDTDWAAQAALRRQELEQLHVRGAPQSDEAARIESNAASHFRALAERGEEADVGLDVLRALAVYQGVKGAEQALVLAERYRAQGGKDGWDAVALAEYALNATVSPETRDEALTRLGQLRDGDRGFLRAYALAARLSTAMGDPETTASELEALTAMNPAHRIGQDLLAWQPEPTEAEAP
ncbi:MAG: hypothetical protein ACKVPX_09180 [Myxococcaceae bacterium]